MQDKICLITGANAGIGQQTALELAQLGATVVIVARDPQRGETARAAIAAATGNTRVDLLQADFAVPDSIRAMTAAFAARYDRLDVLVNNAGVYLTGREETAEGLERTFAVNHLGYFMTTLLLWDSLLAAPAARVINLSSDAHRQAKINFDDLQNKRKYAGFRAYGPSKLANVLFTRELARRLEGTGVTANCFHPGWVASGFALNNGGVIAKLLSVVAPVLARSPEQGADTLIWLATSAEAAPHTGEYFANRAVRRTAQRGQDAALAARLWELSERLCGLQPAASAA